MSFNDIFKSSFLDSVRSFSLTDTLFALVFALVVGLFIFYVYKKTLTGMMYSSSFALTLVGMTTVTTLVIMAVTSNVVLSLGMVGALSIVRFRAAIKDPVEIVFLFWSMAAGIVIGAGLIPLGILGSVIIGVMLVLLSRKRVNDAPYMLVLRCQNEKSEEAAMVLLKEANAEMRMKAKTVTSTGIELSIEVRLKDASTQFVNKLTSLEGVLSAALVTYNGEYMS
ncbi:MAG: DUF4956 domain-containing protein [Cellulosilyticaceae bacterium]